MSAVLPTPNEPIISRATTACEGEAVIILLMTLLCGYKIAPCTCTLDIAMTAMTMTTPAPASHQAAVSFLQSAKLEFEQHRAKKTDPAHENCFGDESFRLTCSTFTKDIVGWRITGDLRATSLLLQDTVCRLLNEKRSHWITCRPKTQSTLFCDTGYAIECFLIGPNQSHASPHVTIHSAQKWVATELRRAIIDSNILKNFARWGCIKLPHHIKPTCYTTRGMNFSPGSDFRCHDYEVRICGRKIPTYLDGTFVEIWKGGSCLSAATVGGLIVVGNRTLALTVAHVFYPSKPALPIESFDIDESEFEFLTSEVSEYGDGISDFADTIRNPSPPPRETAHRTMRHVRTGGVMAKLSESRITVGRLEYISSIYDAQSQTHGGLDWALLAITHPDIIMRNRSHYWNVGRECLLAENQIQIFTASAIITAETVSNAVFGLSSDTFAQPVLVANDGSSIPGDSGSWVFGVSDHQPVGMLIGNCDTLNQCYFLSMEHIMSDIKAQIKLPVKHAPIGALDVVEQQKFSDFVNRMKRRGVDGDGNETYYITTSTLKQYWSQERVWELITYFDQWSCLSYEYFSEKYIRLFSILSFIQQPDAFLWLFENKVDDTFLPCTDMKMLCTYNDAFLDSFEENQWLFCPQDFDESLFKQKFVHPKTILPIVREIVLHLSGNGRTFARVLIDRECNLVMPTEHFLFKTYYTQPTEVDCGGLNRPGDFRDTSTYRDWEEETLAFEALQICAGTEYVINYYGSFVQHNKATIILEDTGTSLEEFLQQNEPPEDAFNMAQFWVSLFKSLIGLEAIQNLPRAHDLRERAANRICNLMRNDEPCTRSSALKIMVCPVIEGVRKQPMFKLLEFAPILEACECHKSRPPLPWKSSPMRIIEEKLRYPSLNHVDMWAFGSAVSQCAVWMLSNVDGRSITGLNRGLVGALVGREEADNAQLDAIYQEWRAYLRSNTTTGFVARFILHHILRGNSESARQLLSEFRAEIPWNWDKNRFGSSESIENMMELPSVFAQAIDGLKQEDIRLRALLTEDRLQPLLIQADSERFRHASSPNISGKASSAGSGNAILADDFSPIILDEIPSEADTENSNITSLLDNHLLDNLGKRPVEIISRRGLSPKTGPQVTVIDIKNWIRGAQKEPILRSVPRLPRPLLEGRLDALRQRRHVFLVDETPAMKRKWKDIALFAEILETDFLEVIGIPVELYFTSEPIIGHHRNVNLRLDDIIRAHIADGTSSINESLEIFVDRITTKTMSTVDPSATWSGQPITIYILTSGIWESSVREIFGNCPYEVDKVMKRLVSELKGLRVLGNFVSIQFIRIGGSNVGKDRFDYLRTALEM
ncbi:hypothetical protein F5B22DRAFT_362296 [Xylaria bambusicola]|uniref:uncharacterized protein n=1 Tax=Xylaria bambusicola TaxID=326684 RepID=UPI002008D88B|nr:uncharacterized protein F5B22DRAFT_362296 [Xylaria bambusicola]KAI0509162.1 hypothetical protein F5B22DRAFT_362296 [Xylaria bambusicola]